MIIHTMFGLVKEHYLRGRYEAVTQPGLDSDSEESIPDQNARYVTSYKGDILLLNQPRNKQTATNRMITCWLLALVCLLAAILLISTAAVTAQTSSAKTRCINPRQRKEWRRLAGSEKQEYINAVKCLMSKPSTFTPGSTRYDDFAYLHTKAGTITHYAASFLPWHRYFIHLFEKALIEECSFLGTIAWVSLPCHIQSKSKGCTADSS